MSYHFTAAHSDSLYTFLYCSAVRAGASLNGPVPSVVSDDEIRDMKQRIFELEEKVSSFES